MIKKMGIFIFMVFLVVLFTSCGQEQTSFEKKIAYITKQNTDFWLYKDNIKLNSLIENQTSFEEITVVSPNANYTIILLDAKRDYDSITTSLLNGLYQLLESNQHIAIFFIDAPDFLFFKNSPFANEKDMYDNEFYINLYYNFEPTSKIKSIQSDFTTSDLENKLSLAVINVAYRVIRVYEGAI